MIRAERVQRRPNLTSFRALSLSPRPVRVIPADFEQVLTNCRNEYDASLGNR